MQIWQRGDQRQVKQMVECKRVKITAVCRAFLRWWRAEQPQCSGLSGLRNSCRAKVFRAGNSWTLSQKGYGAPASELPATPMATPMGYSYGLAPASELPATPMATPMGYSYGLAPASELPATPIATPMGYSYGLAQERRHTTGHPRQVTQDRWPMTGNPA